MNTPDELSDIQKLQARRQTDTRQQLLSRMYGTMKRHSITIEDLQEYERELATDPTIYDLVSKARSRQVEDNVRPKKAHASKPDESTSAWSLRNSHGKKA